MAEFRLMAWVTVGGAVTIEAEDLEKAEEKLEQLISEDEVAFIQHPTMKPGHREWEVLGEL